MKRDDDEVDDITDYELEYNHYEDAYNSLVDEIQKEL